MNGKKSKPSVSLFRLLSAESYAYVNVIEPIECNKNSTPVSGQAGLKNDVSLQPKAKYARQKSRHVLRGQFFVLFQF